MCVSAVQTSQGLYSGLASNVDVSSVVLIVFGGNGSKVTCLFAKIGIPSRAYATDGKQDKLAYVFFLFSLRAQPDCGYPSK